LQTSEHHQRKTIVVKGNPHPEQTAIAVQQFDVRDPEKH
jgi:hypothetical protein